MYQHLPNEDWLKPPIYRSNDTKDSKLLWWGEKSPFERDRGNLGINSQLTIDTAAEVEAGRGKTLHDLLCTEVAFWPNPKKALSLLNAVYDLPDTMVILESTANGHNWFKDRWDAPSAARATTSPVFIGWQEDPNNVRPFAARGARAFIAVDRHRAVGRGRAAAGRGVRLHPRAAALAPQRDRGQGQLRPRLLPPGVPVLPARGVHRLRSPRLRPPLVRAARPRRDDPEARARPPAARVGIFRETDFGAPRPFRHRRGPDRRPVDAFRGHRLPALLRLLGPLEPEGGREGRAGAPIPYPGREGPVHRRGRPRHRRGEHHRRARLLTSFR
jgi:hypothetical protein